MPETFSQYILSNILVPQIMFDPALSLRIAKVKRRVPEQNKLKNIIIKMNIVDQANNIRMLY